MRTETPAGISPPAPATHTHPAGRYVRSPQN